MLPFLFVLGFAAMVVVFGVSVSYFLYKHGAIGQRSARRVARVNAFVTQPAFDEDEDDFRITTDVLVDATSLYARRALLVMLGMLVFVGAFIAMLFH